MIDGPQNGLAPQPWDIPAQPSQLFTPQEALIEVPHTAAVKVIEEQFLHAPPPATPTPYHHHHHNHYHNFKILLQILQFVNTRLSFAKQPSDK